jgi:hypothetical protein
MNQDLAVIVVPFALLVSCALLAAGGLYFFKIRFFGSAGQAGAALILGAIIMGVLQIVLYSGTTGFFKAQELQTSVCELDAESAHPEARRGAGSAVLNAGIVDCMKKAGYQWNTEHGRCRDAPVATNPFCYLPINSFDRTIASVQMSFE